MVPDIENFSVLPLAVKITIISRFKDNKYLFKMTEQKIWTDHWLCCFFLLSFDFQ